MYQILKHRRGFKFRIFDGMEHIRHCLIEDEPGIFRALFNQDQFEIINDRELFISGLSGCVIIPKYNLPKKADYLMLRFRNDKYTAHFHYINKVNALNLL